MGGHRRLFGRTGVAAAARDRRGRAKPAGGAGGARRPGRRVRGVNAVLAASLGAWAFASGRLVDAEFLSDPRGVAAAFGVLVTSGRLFPHLGQTLLEVLGGYAIGVFLGVGLTV